MKKKLFLAFLAVSLLPTALMTVLSSVAIYDQVYQATIKLNTEGLDCPRNSYGITPAR